MDNAGKTLHQPKEKRKPGGNDDSGLDVERIYTKKEKKKPLGKKAKAKRRATQPMKAKRAGQSEDLGSASAKKGKADKNKALGNSTEQGGELALLAKMVVRSGGSKTNEAYIMAPKFVVGVSSKRSGNYRAIVQEVLDQINNGKITTKGEACRLRDELL